MDTVIQPAMTYGAEIWILIKHQEGKLATAQRSTKISLLNITKRDRVQKEEIREKNGIKSILTKVQRSKFKCAGHLARMNNNSWTKKATVWTSRKARRVKGRPKKRWREIFRKSVAYSGCKLHKLHKTEKIGRKFVEATCLQ